MLQLDDGLTHRQRSYRRITHADIIHLWESVDFSQGRPRVISLEVGGNRGQPIEAPQIGIRTTRCFLNAKIRH